MTALILLHVFFASPIALMSLNASLQAPEELEADTKEVREFLGFYGLRFFVVGKSRLHNFTFFWN
jgi:hypothetical protein